MTSSPSRTLHARCWEEDEVTVFKTLSISLVPLHDRNDGGSVGSRVVMDFLVPFRVVRCALRPGKTNPRTGGVFRFKKTQMWSRPILLGDGKL